MSSATLLNFRLGLFWSCVLDPSLRLLLGVPLKVKVCRHSRFSHFTCVTISLQYLVEHLVSITICLFMTSSISTCQGTMYTGVPVIHSLWCSSLNTLYYKGLSHRLQEVFYDFMTICADYTKTLVFHCALCHIVSGLAVWWCRAVSCCGCLCLVMCSVTLCETF